MSNARHSSTPALAKKRQTHPTLPTRAVSSPTTGAAQRPSSRRARLLETLARARLRLAEPPEASPPLPPSRRRRWLIRGVLLVLVIAVVILGHTGRGTQEGTTPGRERSVTTVTRVQARTSMPPLTPTSSTPTSIRPAPTPASALLATSAFLAAYFSWSAGMSDADYRGSWLPLVESTAASALLMAAPRLTLDQGSDNAATSPREDVPASALTLQSQEAQVQIIWQINVLPAGGELVAWQARTIQAMVSLLPTAEVWQIADIVWQSVPQGGA